MSLITNAIGMIQQALAGLPAGTPMHRDALRAVQALSRHVGQQGAPGAGVQKTQLADMLRNVTRNALMARLAQQQGGPGGSPPGPGGGAPPPMPSTPLPGA